MKTAMQELLEQMREERKNIPMPIEWDRCYQAIETLIEKHYVDKEKKQIVEFTHQWSHQWEHGDHRGIIPFFNETFKK